jgi:hypothetical protein
MPGQILAIAHKNISKKLLMLEKLHSHMKII